MDALADLLETRAPEESAALRKRARAAYEEALTRFPESAYGHALAHYLGSGETGRALELALENHRLRPGAEAKTHLAQAYAEHVEGHIRAHHSLGALHATESHPDLSIHPSRPEDATT